MRGTDVNWEFIWRVVLPGDLARYRPRLGNSCKSRSHRSTTLHLAGQTPADRGAVLRQAQDDECPRSRDGLGLGGRASSRAGHAGRFSSRKLIHRWRKIRQVRVRKRKLWWIAGAVVALTVSCAVIASLVTAKERRTEQALEKLVLEYGFREVTRPGHPDWETDYSAPLTSEQQGDDVLRKLEEICSGWDVDVVDSPEFREGVSPIYNFSTQPRGRRIFDVTFSRDSRTPSALAEGARPEMTLLMFRTPENLGFVGWLQDLLPW